LEFDDYSAYTCEQGGIPKFFFKAKSGTLPYTYELYENNVFIQSNQTGDFEYGNVNNEYRIDVTDACGAFFSQDIQVIDIFNYEIIRGDKKVCAGGVIELGCMSLGSTNFSWTGPNGFSSDKQNVSLSNVTTDNAGTYMVTLKPFGCGASISRKTDVEVNTAPPVSVPETIFLCVNGDNTLSGIEPLPNHSLIWYANDKITECPPPVVNTGTVHEEVFYLSQKMDDIGCESEKVKVTIAVKAALASEFSASADEICYKSSPSILLDHLNVDYTYEIYSDKLLTNKLASTTGEVSKLIELDDILEDETTYYIKENDDAGCVSLFLSEVNVTVRKLNIMPENLPPYRQTVAYEQNLTTNGEAPKFTLSEGYLPEGLALSSTGKISGIVPNSERERKTEFTVKVEDVNGCIAFREYVLEGDFVVPKAFTPNGDGVNDYFMLSYKVIIFDRLGIIMFEGEDGWDGTYKGKVVKPDIYFYTLFYQTNLGETKTITGYVGVASR
jgi:gliding motility-associated-like protein